MFYRVNRFKSYDYVCFVWPHCTSERFSIVAADVVFVHTARCPCVRKTTAEETCIVSEKQKNTKMSGRRSPLRYFVVKKNSNVHTRFYLRSLPRRFRIAFNLPRLIAARVYPVGDSSYAFSHELPRPSARTRNLLFFMNTLSLFNGRTALLSRRRLKRRPLYRPAVQQFRPSDNCLSIIVVHLRRGCVRNPVYT